LVSGVRVQALMLAISSIIFVVELVRGDRGVGLGFFVAWAVGAVMLPMLGCSVYVLAVLDARNPNGSW
jgi:hypothetical protein